MNEAIKRADENLMDSDEEVKSAQDVEESSEANNYEALRLDSGNQSATDSDAAHEDEYIDEDKYTTVTVEPMNESSDEQGSLDHEKGNGNQESTGRIVSTGKEHSSGNGSKTSAKKNINNNRKKRKKFRYESKTDKENK